MALILGIESTCDETAAAVVADGRTVRSNVVASQAEIHAKYRGVVPEIASRHHIENILPVLREGLSDAGVRLEDIDAIAVAHRPGLIGSLLIGVTAAKTLAWALGKPLIGVDHVHAHLYSVMLNSEVGSALRTDLNGPQCGPYRDGHSERSEESRRSSTESAPSFPAVGLVVRGGHTALYEVKDFSNVTLIGTTIDDAVGEAYDKVAAILGLGYPGGPIIDRLAQDGDSSAVKFPRTLLGRDSLDFSFSGLKTSVLYHVRGVPGKHQNVKERGRPLSGKELPDIAACFQAACVDVLITKLKRAARRIGAKSVIIGGGVSANRGLRAALAGLSLPIFLPELKYCTDNAAMSAGLAHLAYERGEFSALDLDAITYSRFM